jgi:hypothetical protein
MKPGTVGLANEESILNRWLSSPWLPRALIAIVLFWNLQCAAVFLVDPASYLSMFELAGVPGQAVVRGIGILFLMWNVPYALAAWNPIRHRTSLQEALVMQAIGLAGEGALWLMLPPAHAGVRLSIMRFICFDATGLVLLLAAWSLVRRKLVV